MTYSDLIEHDAGETEIRSYLVNGDVVPVTMRIPANLRDSAKRGRISSRDELFGIRENMHD